MAHKFFAGKVLPCARGWPSSILGVSPSGASSRAMSDPFTIAVFFDKNNTMSVNGILNVDFFTGWNKIGVADHFAL